MTSPAIVLQSLELERLLRSGDPAEEKRTPEVIESALCC